MRSAILHYILLAILVTANLCAAESTSNIDWPQWRGPNRNGVVVNSPKLLDSWPTEGPPLLWKSDWVQGSEEGGCGHPVVANGKVFVYSNAKIPVQGGDGYLFITKEVLIDAGWLPDLPEALAGKIEAAWASADRPKPAGWKWWEVEWAKQPKDKELDEFLAKNPALDKYIKDFIATLQPDEAKKYGAYIRRRLCIEIEGGWGKPSGLPWDTLQAMSKLVEVRYRSRYDWTKALKKISPKAAAFCECYPSYAAWKRTYFWADSVVCLDAASGKTLWRKDFPRDSELAGINHNDWSDHIFFGTGAHSTPAIVGEFCYVAGSRGVYCFSVKDGALVWFTKSPPSSASLIVADGVVYESNNGCAYDAKTGALLWRNPLFPGKGGSGSVNWHRWNLPLLWSKDGKKYLITGDGSNGLFCCLELQSGKVLWSEKSAAGWFPNLQGDLLVMPTPWPHGSDRIPKDLMGPKLFRLTLAGPELIWKRNFHDTEGDVIYQGHLYVHRMCVDLRTGEVNWRNHAGDNLCLISPPLLVDGKVIVFLEGGGQIESHRDPWSQVLMYKATPEKFIQLGVFNPRACVMSSPAFSDGKLFVRLTDGVACYDLQEHGVYLGGATATKDTLTFQFKQTGGGLIAKDGLKDVLVTDATGAAKTAQTKLDGDNIVVDIRNMAVPFKVSCPAANTLSGKNGKPVPAFEWNTARALKIRKCVDNEILLESDLPLLPEGDWSKAGTYSISDAKIVDVTIDPNLRTTKLTTNKSWKAGDAFTLTYASFPVEKGDPRHEILKHTIVETPRPSATFVKIDGTTGGDWKGVYGKDGAIIDSDKASAAPGYAVVKAPKGGAVPWAPNRNDKRYLQKTGEGTERSVSFWLAHDQFEISIEFTDGKEHQVAAYCLGWVKVMTMTVEVLDPDTRAVLDTRTFDDYTKIGKYLVWNVKGRVVLRFIMVGGTEGTNAAAGGVFFDPPGSAAK